MITPDSEIDRISKDMETEIKKIKHEVYKLSWYMRGGVDSTTLLTDSDVGDLEILSKIVQENIEATKTAGMPLI